MKSRRIELFILITTSALILVACTSKEGGETAILVVNTAPIVTNSPTILPTATCTAVSTYTQQPIATPRLGIGSTLMRSEDGAVMVYVPEGDFIMGNDDNEYLPDEKPAHKVYLETFWIDRTEVTNSMFAEFLNAQGNQEEGHVTWLDVTDSDARIHENGETWDVIEGFEDHPVVEVTWFAARAYCEWVSARLPTEAEWEKASGGTDGRLFPWGNSEPGCSLFNYWAINCLPYIAADVSILPGSYQLPTTLVGSYPDGASPYEAMDMAGNVSEWVMDWYDEGYYSYSPASNPQGPVTGSYRVFRGSSWRDDDYYITNLYLSHRRADVPTMAYETVGFRCARP